MALFDVSDFKRFSDLRRQILPTGQTRLKHRTTHYSFGLKQQELAVPLGVDVSILIFSVKLCRGYQPLTFPKVRVGRDADRASPVFTGANSPFSCILKRIKSQRVLNYAEQSLNFPLAIVVSQVVQR